MNHLLLSPVDSDTRLITASQYWSMGRIRTVNSSCSQYPDSEAFIWSGSMLDVESVCVHMERSVTKEVEANWLERN